MVAQLFRKRAAEERAVIMKKTYNIEVDCANCAAKMEEAAQKTDGCIFYDTKNESGI